MNNPCGFFRVVPPSHECVTRAPPGDVRICVIPSAMLGPYPILASAARTFDALSPPYASYLVSRILGCKIPIPFQVERKGSGAPTLGHDPGADVGQGQKV